MRKFSIASAWYHGLEKHNAVDTYHFRQTSRLQLLQWNILGFGYCQLLLISGILLLDSGKLLLISGKLLLNCGKLLLNCGKFWPGQKTNRFLCVFHSFFTRSLHYYPIHAHKKHILKKNLPWLAFFGRSWGSNILLPPREGCHRLLNWQIQIQNHENKSQLSRAIN